MTPTRVASASASLAPLPRRGTERRTRRRLRLALLFVSAVLLLNAIFGERGFVETYRVRKEYQALASEVETLKAQNAALRDEARRLREDPAAIERVARRDLGMIRPGEVVVLVKTIVPKGAAAR